MACTDHELREILSLARTIAVVGIKADESEDAFRIPHYLQECGYRILPVNPKLEDVLGCPCHQTLGEITEPIDIVDLFRSVAHVPAHVDEILSLETRPKAVWMQLGIQHDESARRLRSAGIQVVQDLCIMVEHHRLLDH